MLEQLAGDGDVERIVIEWERILDVGPARLDPELSGPLERVAVDVDTDDVVAAGIVLSQRAVAAAEVEHAPSRPAYRAPKELDAFESEDEVLWARGSVVLAVALARPLDPAHDHECSGT